MTTVIAKYSQFVMPDHINVVGTLFGGQMIAWVDLAAAKASYRFLKGSDVDGSVTRTIEFFLINDLFTSLLFLLQ